jgi:hypothetical protein
MIAMPSIAPATPTASRTGRPFGSLRLFMPISWLAPAWRRLLLLGVLTGLPASLAAPAIGSEALFLSWEDCGPAPGSSQLITGACGDGPPVPLYCAFQVPVAIDGVLALEMVIDVQHSDAALPSWWRFDPGGCMEWRLLADTQFGGVSSTCTDPWNGGAFALVQDYLVGQPGNDPSRARIKLVTAIPSPSAVVLASDVVYHGARLLLPAGEVACQGCGQAACLVFNSILIRRLPGSPGGDVYLETPAPGDGNWAHWGGTGSACSAVPATGTSWGQIKALYR